MPTATAATAATILSHKMPFDVCEMIATIAMVAFEAELQAKARAEVHVFVSNQLILNPRSRITRDDFIRALNDHMRLHGLPEYDPKGDKSLWQLLCYIGDMTVEKARYMMTREIYIYGWMFK